MKDHLDLGIIIGYLVFIVSLGLWVAVRGRKRSDDSARNYFLASGTLKWPVIGLALFSTNISTIHLVALAQQGFDNGLAFGNFEWMAAFTLIILSLFFVPFYIRAKVTTLPDFLEKRYNASSRDMLAVLSVFSAIFIHIGFSLYTGGIVLEAMFGIPLAISIIAICALVGLYTVLGGLSAVVITEAIETVVLLLGAIIITVICFMKFGSWSEFTEVVKENQDGQEMLSVLRPHGDKSELPWYAVLLGYPVIGIWYWCADQTIVQRVLGAKDENHARIGPLFAGFIKILPVFLFVLPGLMAFALVKNGTLDENRLANHTVGTSITVDGRDLTVADQPLAVEGSLLNAGGKSFDIKGKTCLIETRPSVLHPDKTERVLIIDGQLTKNSEDTYAFMIRELLSPGVRGIITAALLAALMGTIAGALNSVSTLVSYDLVKRWRPDTGEHTLVKVGRITAVITVVVAVVWSLQLGRYKSIFDGIVSLISYVAPPITAVFLGGIFWKRASGFAATTTLIIGALLGLTVFLLDWNSDVTSWEVPGLMAGFYLFVICSVILFVASMIRPHQHTEESARLVWAHPLEAVRTPGWPGLADYRVVAGVLFVTMIILYWVFR